VNWAHPLQPEGDRNRLFRYFPEETQGLLDCHRKGEESVKMAEEPENHTLALLREMRAENAAFRKEMEGFRKETTERFERVEADIGRVHADVAAVKADVAAVKADVAAVKVDVAVVTGDVAKTHATAAQMHADVLATKSLALDIVVKLTALENRVKALEDA
jgi:uncharacterized protein (UPF0335 family)